MDKKGGGGVSRFSIETFSSHSAENFRKGILYCCNNFGYRESLDKGGGEYHDFPSKFLSHCTEIFHWRNTLVFQKNSFIENFHAYGGASRFCRNFLSHKTEKTSPGNHSVFQKISGREKNFMDKRGGVSRFSVEKFLSHCTKIFHWRTLWCFRNFFIRKFSCIGRRASRFCRNFLSHRTETKSFVLEPFCLPEIFCYRKKIYG